MLLEIEQKLPILISLFKQHHVRAISLFGSAAKNQMTSKSDVDFLVEFSEKLPIIDYADNYFSLLESIQALLHRKVDLLNVHALKNPILLDEINKTKIELYAA